MSKVRIYGDTSGYIDVAAPATADNSTLDLSRVVKEDASGNVGIGTDSPSNFAGYTALCLDNATNSGLLELQKDGTTYGQAFVDGSVLRIRSSATATGMVFDTNGGNERMRIDDSGRVTMPYQPAFYAYASNSYSATTTNELVKFNATSFDTGNNFDISAGNHKFVAPVSGVYSFQSTINTYSVGVGSILRTDLYVNGSAVSRGDYMISDHTGDQNVSISVTRSLSANDYVQIYHISDDTSRGFSGNGTWVWFSGFLVG